MKEENIVYMYMNEIRRDYLREEGREAVTRQTRTKYNGNVQK